MKIDGKAYRSVWPSEDGRAVRILDQTRLPHAVEILTLADEAAVADAIRTMKTRGAPLIGACGAYGLALALAADPSDANLTAAWERLHATRPTAINLRWALDRVRDAVKKLAPRERGAAAFAEADAIADEDVGICAAIGRHGLALIREAAAKSRGGTVNVLTHCNAGWLATVDVGTALAPIYVAHDRGVPLHVWVDETRPRNQGASLTAFELGQHGVRHTVIPDNTGGHLMQHGEVDIAIVGTDRVTAQGDVCNKIGTYLKALAAKDNGVPFYVALPSSTIDFTVNDGVAEIPIEERAGDEVTKMTGRTADGKIETVTITPQGSPVANYGFDVTPARLVSGLITERGIVPAQGEALAKMFADHPSRKPATKRASG
jgi:methylthioribose-1-phosphate isomerase